MLLWQLKNSLMSFGPDNLFFYQNNWDLLERSTDLLVANCLCFDFDLGGLDGAGAL